MTVSVKSLQKQLIAAIAMVLVAMIALGSSTYAWFASNTTVTASTTSISAKSDVPFLLISNESSGEYKTTATITAAATNLLLVTPLNLGRNIGYFADKAAANSSTTTTPSAATSPDTVLWGTTHSTDVAEVQAEKTTTLVPTGDLSKYVLTTHVYIKTATNTTAKNLKMDKPAVTADTNTISDAYRIIAVAPDGKYQIYDKGLDTVTGSTILADTVDTSVIDITLFVFFDGTDDVSYTNKATDLSNISSTLSFSVDETVA